MSFTNEVELLSKKHVSENMFSGWGLSGLRCIKQQGDFSTPVFLVCYHSANPPTRVTTIKIWVIGVNFSEFLIKGNEM